VAIPSVLFLTHDLQIGASLRGCADEEDRADFMERMIVNFVQCQFSSAKVAVALRLEEARPSTNAFRGHHMFEAG